MKMTHVAALAALALVGCGIHDPTPTGQLTDEGYEKIAGPLNEAGMYKFYDIPEQKVCYLFIGNNGRSALSCDPVDSDLKAHRSNIYHEAPGPD